MHLLSSPHFESGPRTVAWITVLLALLLIAAGTAGSGETPANQLRVARGPTPDEITLQWTGPGPAWEIFFSNSPQDVATPSNKLDETYELWWTDAMSTAPIEYIRVITKCISGSPEICDYFDNDCDGLIDEGYKDPTGEFYDRQLHCGSCDQSCAPEGMCVLASDCTGTVEPVCTGLGPPPCVGLSCEESCDYIDNDQDCDVDEEFRDPSGEYSVDNQHCGGCYQACSTSSDPSEICQLLPDCNTEPYLACAPLGTCIGTLCPEVCDNADNNLNCLVDEDFRDAEGRYVDDQHCGRCGNDCTLLLFGGQPGSCNPYPGGEGLDRDPICSVTCTGSCFDVNGNPGDGCECCDPQPVETCGDPGQNDSDCDGPDPFDSDCVDWPLPIPFAEPCLSPQPLPIPVLLGCDGEVEPHGDPIVLYELDVDGDQVYDYSAAEPVFVESVFPVLGNFRIYCRVTDSQNRTMYYWKDFTTDVSVCM